MKNNHQTFNQSQADKQVLQELNGLQELLEAEMNLSPESSLDKQVLAAAHRESLKPIKRQNYRRKGWRRFSLPLYILSGFTLTVFAFNALWLPILKNPVDKIESPTIVTIESQQSQQVIPVQENSAQKRTLPEPIVPAAIPERVVSKPDKSPIEVEQELTSESMLIEQGIYTGNELIKADYPEKEAWVQQIIKHLRNGESELARSELIHFKKAYPDYPIEEQIKVLNR